MQPRLLLIQKQHESQVWLSLLCVIVEERKKEEADKQGEGKRGITRCLDDSGKEREEGRDRMEKECEE